MCTEADSRLGWEPSMGYVGGVEQMQWKLEHMRRLYGDKLSGRDAPRL